MLAIGRVYWADLLQERQRILRDALDDSDEPLVVRADWWSQLLAPLRRLRTAFKKAEHTFVAEFVGDVIGYLGPGAHAAVHAALAKTLDELAASLRPPTLTGC